MRYYGQWMRDEAEKRIGHLYPKIEVTAAMVAGSAGILPARPDLKPLVGQKLTVIAWLWARTVKSPNPAFNNVDVPLASTFLLSTKPGKEAWVEVEMGAPASQPASRGDQNTAKDGGAPVAFKPSFLPASRDTSRVITSVESPEPHLGWHSRGYLPHWDHPGMIQSLTFRLHDAVPREVVEQWQAELELNAAGRDAGAPSQIELQRRVEKYEDAGHGACWLCDPRIAALVENALLHFDGQRYRLIAWCIMPNHIHALIETWEGWPVAGVLHSWKSFTASEGNKLLGRSGPFWFREYHDRYIRNAEHYAEAIRYIEGNPVKAGLASQATDWNFSSARHKAALGASGAPVSGAPVSGAPASQPAGGSARFAATDGGAPGYRFLVKTRARHGAPPPEAKDGTKLELAYRFREGLRKRDWEAAIAATEEYRQVRTRLCPAYMAGASAILRSARQHGGTAFPLGAGGGGGVLAISPEPGALVRLRAHLAQFNREVPFRVLGKGYARGNPLAQEAQK